MNEKRIKICHMSSAHTSEDKRIFYEEAVSLAANGYDVFYVVQGETFSKYGVRVVGVKNNTKNRIGRMLFFSKKIYKEAMKINADIYHFHDPELLPYGLRLAKKKKIVIFDSHENTAEQIYEKEWIPTGIRGIFKKIYEKYQKYVCKHLDCIISVSPHICEYFEKFHDNVEMITNYPPFFQNVPCERKERVICYAGNISDQWNHKNIIKAVNNIGNVNYLLAGRGSKSYIESLKDMQGWEKVDFRGEVSHEEVPIILQKAAVGMALLSYNRNVGGHRGTLGNTKIYEEMMAGLPVICTDFELWREMINKYDCGICVNPENPREIEDAIRYLLDNPEKAKKMGENAIKAVKEEYNWKTQEVKLLNLYMRLLNGKIEE